MQKVEHLVAANCELGEGPLWHAQEKVIYWTDILNNRLHSYNPASEVHAIYEVGMPVGCFGLRASGGFILAAGNAFAFWDPERGVEIIQRLDEIQGEARFNDGKVDPQGNFWAGEKNDQSKGKLYRIDGDKEVTVMASGIKISNGPAWSPDQTKMYYTDSATNTIGVYDYDPGSGKISNWRPFMIVPEETGTPDGLTVDAEGCVWSAMWGGWRVMRFTPEGEVDQEIRLPVERVSSCFFGGPNLDELYITTAQEGMDGEERRLQPQAGDIFRYRAGVRGLPAPFYQG